MTLEKGWAEKLPEETIRSIISVGDGHTLYEPSAYIEAGMPKEIVDGFTQTHYSERTVNYDALEAITECLAKLWKEQRDAFPQDQEFLAEEIISSLMCKDIHEVSAWSPKGSIWKNGQIVESMEAVYGLEVVCALAKDLGVSYEPAMGRGFQYARAAKAVEAWLDKKGE